MSHDINPSIGNSGLNPDFNIDSSLIVGGVPGLNPIIFQSTISPSEQSSSTTPIDSGSPRLQDSVLNDVKVVAYYKLVAKFNEAAEIFLEGWNKALEEQKEITKEYLKSSDYLNMLDNKSQTTISAAESKNSVTDRVAIKGPSNLDGFVSSIPIELALAYLNFNVYGTTPGVSAIIGEANKLTAGSTPVAPTQKNNVNSLAAQESSKSVEIGVEHFIAASLIIGAGITAVSQTAVDPTQGGLHVESKVIQDAYSAIIPLQEQSAAAVLMAGWFSAMWGTSMMLQTTAQNLDKYKGVEGDDTKKVNVDMAKSYAANVIENLRSPAFQRLIVEMVLQTEENIPADQKVNMDKLVEQSKVVLLSTALALVSKLDVAGGLDEGWFNELDFEGLLDGTTKLDQNDIHGTKDIKQQLINEIQIALSQLSPADSHAIVLNLKEYFKSLPSVENLLDQQKVLADVMPGILNPKKFEDNYLDYTSV